MSFFGFILLFSTGFLWSWGAQISKKIEKFEGHHRSFYTFWGAYHRFNKFFLQVSDYPRFMQAMLAPIFFVLAIVFTNTWLEWGFIICGGASFILLQILADKIKKASSK